MKTLVIMTGPQGAGNHLFSKALATNPSVFGWNNLLDTYWEGHDQEPFAEYWINPAKLSEFDWAVSDVFVTSISCPFIYKGIELQPNYDDFINEASKYVDVKILVIGRDVNILNHQQNRVRGKETTHVFKESLEQVLAQHNPMFVSQELLYLYATPYLNSIERYIGLPQSDDDTLLEILKDNANAKYIEPVVSYWLDKEVKIACMKK